MTASWQNVEKYNIDQILFAIPTARVEDRRDILNICKETKCELKTLPGVFQLANGQVSLSKMKAVAVEDLLGRDPIKVNMEEIFQYIKGKQSLLPAAVALLEVSFAGRSQVMNRNS